MSEKLEQNTEAWLEYRRGGIGASDMNAIMGASPYSTSFEIYLEKIGEAKDKDIPKFITSKGHELEVIARNKYEIETGLEFREQLVEHDKFKHFRASLDGKNDSINACWECKYIGAEFFKQVQNGILPEKYKPQVHWQIFVSGSKENHFTCINDEHELTTMIVKADLEYMKELLSEAKKFWKCVTTKTPPKLTPQDKLVITDEKVITLLKKYHINDGVLKGAKATSDKIKDEIFKLLKHSSNSYKTDLFSFSVNKQTRKGNVDYAKYFEDQKIDTETLEPYRKKSSSAKVIKITKLKAKK